MELKVVCGCGQKYAFDVEPVGGQMPFTVSCPSCQADGTATANALLSQASTGTAPPPLPASPGKLRMFAQPAIARAVQPPPPLPPPTGIAPRPSALPNRANVAPVENDFSLGRGIAGAVLGAIVGCGLLYAFWAGTQIRFPLMGVVTGFTTGFGASLLGKGKDSTLGIISSVMAAATLAGTFFMMYGELRTSCFISIAVGAYGAYRSSAN